MARVSKTGKNLLKKKKIGFIEADLLDIISICVLSAGLVTMLLVKAIMHPVIVQGNSMNPTYENGDILLTNTKFTPDDLECGTVVVFQSPDEKRREYIKRIEGRPGDTIQIVDGLLYRNGEAVAETFDVMEDAGDYSEPITLQGGDDPEFFVLGDNRNNSRDSRFIGAIEFSKIDGIVRTEKKAFNPRKLVQKILE